MRSAAAGGGGVGVGGHGRGDGRECGDDVAHSGLVVVQQDLCGGHLLRAMRSGAAEGEAQGVAQCGGCGGRLLHVGAGGARHAHHVLLLAHQYASLHLGLLPVLELGQCRSG